MDMIKIRIEGNSFIGTYLVSTDKYVFMSSTIGNNKVEAISKTLHVKPIVLSIYDAPMIGILARANSNGIILSNLFDKDAVEQLKNQDIDINVEIIKSGLNAIGNNVLANDKIAIVNPEYSNEAVKQIRDALNVEVIKEQIGIFKTVGANNVITNKGMLINNNVSDEEKAHIDKLTGFDSIRTTANIGFLGIGLSIAANSYGAVIGEDTTGFELGRIMEALEGEN
ncbi:MAG: translation initiation factor IF-6 [Candidatus Micrarchaeia archaeon]